MKAHLLFTTSLVAVSLLTVGRVYGGRYHVKQELRGTVWENGWQELDHAYGCANPDTAVNAPSILST